MWGCPEQNAKHPGHGPRCRELRGASRPEACSREGEETCAVNRAQPHSCHRSVPPSSAPDSLGTSAGDQHQVHRTFISGLQGEGGADASTPLPPPTRA